MTYFTASKSGKNYILDSFSDSYDSLRTKFPKEIIYKSDNLLKSIYLTKQQLIRADG